MRTHSGKKNKAAQLNYVVVKNKSYGHLLKGVKIYYEGKKRPKRLGKDGSINFGKNILELLGVHFKKFRWIITADKDEIIEQRKIFRVRTSQKTLGRMYSDQFSRNRDIKNDIIRHRFSAIYPSYFKKSAASVYVPGTLSEVLSRATLSRLSSADRDALNKLLPEFIAAESVGAINLLKAATQIKTLKELARDLADAIQADYSESWWQKYIQRNILIIQQGYIKAIDRINISVGTIKLPDFSLITHDNYLDILEIKKPSTDLMKFDEGRGNYFFSSELSKAISQVENYISNATAQRDAIRSFLKDKYEVEMRVLRPRGIILAGNASLFKNTKEKDDFRLLSQSLKNVSIITYDELLTRLLNYINILEGFQVKKKK